MSTNNPMPLRDNAGDTHAGDDLDDSYVHVAGSPRRARRRRALLLLVALVVASLAVLVPIGLLFHRQLSGPRTVSTTATRAVRSTATSAPPAENTVPDNSFPAKPPPYPWALDPALSRALDRARAQEKKAGLTLRLTSGFRNAAAQQQLYDQAIAKYGSPQKARHWVLPPEESAHVKGLAIDVGPIAAAKWLERFGVRDGLCRRYRNEWWHFELLAPHAGAHCPALEPYAGG